MNKIKNRIKRTAHNASVNKKGFSLVELLVCAAILGIVALCVSVMMNSGSKMFTNVNKRVNVSYRTQLAMTQIKEFFTDCDAICIDDGTIYIQNNDMNGDTAIFAFDYDEENKKILMTQYRGLSFEEQPTVQPFSDNISQFEISVTATDDGKNATAIKVKVQAELDGTKYAQSQVFSLKNKPVYLTEKDDGDISLQQTFLKRIGGNV